MHVGADMVIGEGDVVKLDMRRVGLGRLGRLGRLRAAFQLGIQHLLQAVGRGQRLGIHGEKTGDGQHGVEDDGEIA